jgi:hypothetical protein
VKIYISKNQILGNDSKEIKTAETVANKLAAEWTRRKLAVALQFAFPSADNAEITVIGRVNFASGFVWM